MWRKDVAAMIVVDDMKIDAPVVWMFLVEYGLMDIYMSLVVAAGRCPEIKMVRDIVDNELYKIKCLFEHYCRVRGYTEYID